VFNAAVALSFMVFVLLYFPCIATITAIKNESGSWKWGLFEIVYTLVLAYIAAFIVYRLALFLI
jgi:ferrous iron transport protein B